MDDEPRICVTQPLTVAPRIAFERVQPLSSLIAVEFAAQSHAGGQAVNTDNYLVIRLGRHQETLAGSLRHGEVPDRFDEAAFGMVVADGMGASGVGETASRLAIATLAHLFLHFGRWNVRIDEATAAEVLERAERFYHSVAQTVTEAGYAHPTLSGMSTTLTAAFIASDTLFIAHVGHSRVYLFRDGRLTQSTRDQPPPQRLPDTAQPAPIELPARDLRHILPDAIGGRTGSPAPKSKDQVAERRPRALVHERTDGRGGRRGTDGGLGAGTLDEQCLALWNWRCARRHRQHHGRWRSIACPTGRIAAGTFPPLPTVVGLPASSFVVSVSSVPSTTQWRGRFVAIAAADGRLAVDDVGQRLVLQIDQVFPDDEITPSGMSSPRLAADRTMPDRRGCRS